MSFNYENLENGVCELNRDATDGSVLVALTTRTGYTFGQFLNISVSIDYYYVIQIAIIVLMASFL